MNWNREQCSSRSEDVRRRSVIPALNPRNVNFIEHCPKQTGIPATDYRLRKVAPFPLSYLEAGAQTLDDRCKVACCIPSRPRFVGSRSCSPKYSRREDAYQDTQDYTDLRPRGVLLFLTWLESCAMQPGANRLMILSGHGSQEIVTELRAFFRQPVDQIGLTCGARSTQDSLQARFGMIPVNFRVTWPPCRTSSVRRSDTSLRQRMSPL